MRKQPTNPSIAKRNAWSAAGSRTVWSLAKAVSRGSSPSNFPSVCNASDDILCGVKVFAFHFVPNSTLPRHPIPPFTSLLQPSLAPTRFAKHCASWACTNRPVRTVFHWSSIKCVSLIWSLFHAVISVIASTFLLSHLPENIEIFSFPRSDNLCDPKDYHRTFLSSVTSNLSETIIYDHLWLFLKRQVRGRQHGLRQRRFTSDLLILVSHLWLAALDNHIWSPSGLQPSLHKELLGKLLTFGLPLAPVSWVSSFISKRTISIRVHEVLSQPFSANAGVPQCSLLTLTFYLLTIFYPTGPNSLPMMPLPIVFTLSHSPSCKHRH